MKSQLFTERNSHMRSTLIIYVLILLIGLQSHGQKSTPESRSAERIAQNIFLSIENKQVKQWIFGFVHPDSSELVKIKQLIPYLNLEYARIYFQADSASLRYPRGYVLETYDKAEYDQETLIERIKTLDKIGEKRKVILGQIGIEFDEQSVSDMDTRVAKETPDNVIQNSGGLLKGSVRGDAEALPFATVGISEKNIGTISDADGYFELEIPASSKKDTLTISYVGYATQQIPVRTIDFSNPIKIDLKSVSVILNEVVVETRQESKRIILGQKKASNKTGYIHGTGAGAEVARLMDARNKSIYLNEVSVFVENKNGGSFNLLLNVYEQDSLTQLPGRQLLKEQIIVESRTTSGWLAINLNDQYLVLDQPFYVAFQWVSADSRNPLISLAGPKAPTYFRSTALGKWKKAYDFSNFVIKLEATVLK